MFGRNSIYFLRSLETPTIIPADSRNNKECQVTKAKPMLGMVGYESTI